MTLVAHHRCVRLPHTLRSRPSADRKSDVGNRLNSRQKSVSASDGPSPSECQSAQDLERPRSHPVRPQTPGTS